jgi:hypothetical protein
VGTIYHLISSSEKETVVIDSLDTHFMKRPNQSGRTNLRANIEGIDLFGEQAALREAEREKPGDREWTGVKKLPNECETPTDVGERR